MFILLYFLFLFVFFTVCVLNYRPCGLSRRQLRKILLLLTFISLTAEIAGTSKQVIQSGNSRGFLTPQYYFSSKQHVQVNPDRIRVVKKLDFSDILTYLKEIKSIRAHIFSQCQDVNPENDIARFPEAEHYSQTCDSLYSQFPAPQTRAEVIKLWDYLYEHGIESVPTAFLCDSDKEVTITGPYSQRHRVLKKAHETMRKNGIFLQTNNQCTAAQTQNDHWILTAYNDTLDRPIKDAPKSLNHKRFWLHRVHSDSSDNVTALCYKTDHLKKIEREYRKNCDMKLQNIDREIADGQASYQRLLEATTLPKQSDNPFNDYALGKLNSTSSSSKALHERPKRFAPLIVGVVLGVGIATSFILGIVNAIKLEAIQNQVEDTADIAKRNEERLYLELSNISMNLDHENEELETAFAERDKILKQTFSIIQRNQLLESAYTVYTSLASKMRDSLIVLSTDIQLVLNKLISGNIISDADFKLIMQNMPPHIEGQLSRNFRQYEIRPTFYQKRLAFEITIPLIQPSKAAKLLHPISFPVYKNNTKFVPSCKADFLAVFQRNRQYSVLTPQEWLKCQQNQLMCDISSPRYDASVRRCAISHFFNQKILDDYKPVLEPKPTPFFATVGSTILYSVPGNMTIYFECNNMNYAGSDKQLNLHGHGFLPNPDRCSFTSDNVHYTPHLSFHTNFTLVKEAPFHPPAKVFLPEMENGFTIDRLVTLPRYLREMPSLSPFPSVLDQQHTIGIGLGLIIFLVIALVGLLLGFYISKQCRKRKKREIPKAMPILTKATRKMSMSEPHLRYSGFRRYRGYKKSRSVDPLGIAPMFMSTPRPSSTSDDSSVLAIEATELKQLPAPPDFTAIKDQVKIPEVSAYDVPKSRLQIVRDTTPVLPRKTIKQKLLTYDVPRKLIPYKHATKVADPTYMVMRRAIDKQAAMKAAAMNMA